MSEPLRPEHALIERSIFSKKKIEEEIQRVNTQLKENHVDNGTIYVTVSDHVYRDIIAERYRSVGWQVFQNRHSSYSLFFSFPKESQSGGPYR